MFRRACSGTTSLLMSNVRRVESLSSAVPNRSHTDTYSLQGLSLEFRTQVLLLFSCIALMTAEYWSSMAPESLNCSSIGSPSILLWNLLMVWTEHMCASIVISLPKLSIMNGPCFSVSLSHSGFQRRVSRHKAPLWNILRLVED